jgi:hypothetical protein
LCITETKIRYAQPESHTIQIGPPQVIMFKSTVILDGQTFGSLQNYRTVKEAEFNAAKFALMSLSQESKPLEKMLVGSTNILLLWMVLICTTSLSL